LLGAQTCRIEAKPVPVPVADRDIDILAREIDVMHGRRDTKVNARMRLSISSEALYEPLGREVW
jgi:hypothetical protein